MQKSLAVLSLLGLASAQSTVVDLFLLGFEDNSLVGSVIASDASATTYSITCASTATSAASALPSQFESDTDGPLDDYCGVPEDFTFIQGPSTIHYAYTYVQSDLASESVYGSMFVDVGCKITSSLVDVCTAENRASIDGTSTSELTTITFTSGMEDETLLTAFPVTITAGNLPSNTNAAKTTAASGATGASGATNNSGSPSATGNAPSSRISDGAAMPMMTAKAQWIVGGAAALALAAL